LVHEGRVIAIRLAAASVADRPVRLMATEAALQGRMLTARTKAEAKSVLLSEVLPIDDIRSSARYRKHVAANLLDEFLNELMQGADGGRSK
jgi:CO/xanthine dehydrogenase FAD-binding subunit